MDKSQKNLLIVVGVILGCLLLAGFSLLIAGGIWIAYQHLDQRILTGPSRSTLLENEFLFYTSQGYKAGVFLKEEAPGARILLIVSNESLPHPLSQKLIQALRDGYQGEVVMDSITTNSASELEPLYLTMKATDFDAVVKRHPDCGIVISTIGLPSDSSWLTDAVSAEERPQLLLMGLPAGPMPGLYEAVQNDRLSGLIMPNPNGLYDVPAPKDPLAAFDIRHVLITRKNVADYKTLLALF